MEQRVRISDIAEELGLSTATVSNVIHGKTKKISDKTVKRVQALLEERQYMPGMAEVLLTMNPSRIVGVFVNDHEKYEGHTFEDAFIASSLNCLATQLEEQGLFMMVKKAKKPEEILHFASMWNMDGLVVIGFCRQDYCYLRDHMRIPFVVYDGICEKTERIVNITIDNFDGGRQMGALFHRLGHSRALCISDNEIGVDQERMDGFRAGFGGSVESMVIPMHREERHAFYLRHTDQLRAVTAVFAVSDYYAVDLIHFLGEQGISVPEELSVGGFDDIPLCELLYPSLTTIRQDGMLRAKLALEKLRALKLGEAVGEVITLPVSLVERGSTRSPKRPA